MKFTGKTILSLWAIIIIAGVLFYILWGGLEKNIVYFVSPTELVEKGKGAIDNPVRLGGVVAKGSLKDQESVISFDLTDDVNVISVITTKTPPEMFQEGIGIVVEGAMRADGKFHADRLMVRHGSEYKPPKEGEMPQDIYQDLQRKKPSPNP